MGFFTLVTGIPLHWFGAVIVDLILLYYGLYLLTALYFATKHKFQVPGPMFVTPVIGGIIAMLRDPTTFWWKQYNYAPNGISWTSIVNQYVVFATKAEIVHKIFDSNSKDTLTLALHPNGKIILTENNIAFQSGPQHKALRSSFMNLFGFKALSFYLPRQEACVRKHMIQWLEKINNHNEEMRDHIRFLNFDTSQTIFIGKWIPDVTKFNIDYTAMTNGFLTYPIYLPGTTLWNAVRGRRGVIEQLTVAAHRSKEHMSEPDAQPTCLFDFWSVAILQLIDRAKENGEAPPAFTGDGAMADTMMDFLFASQDASTASLVSLVSTMCDYPEVLERVREEQHRLRPNNEPLTYDIVQEMTFTRQCVLEQLRIRPPAPMVPMLANNDFRLTSSYVAPKGTLIIPSLVGACREGFTDPDRFDPDRFGPERQEDRKFVKQYIPFGVGPHRCPGYNYAIQHLTVFLAVLAVDCEWVRTRTPKSDEIIYLPTLYPADCLIQWKRRDWKAAAAKYRK